MKMFLYSQTFSKYIATIFQLYISLQHYMFRFLPCSRMISNSGEPAHPLLLWLLLGSGYTFCFGRQVNKNILTLRISSLLRPERALHHLCIHRSNVPITKAFRFQIAAGDRFPSLALSAQAIINCRSLFIVFIIIVIIIPVLIINFIVTIIIMILSLNGHRHHCQSS